jgi:hypothetical protein
MSANDVFDSTKKSVTSLLFNRCKCLPGCNNWLTYTQHLRVFLSLVSSQVFFSAMVLHAASGTTKRFLAESIQSNCFLNRPNRSGSCLRFESCFFYCARVAGCRVLPSFPRRVYRIKLELDYDLSRCDWFLRLELWSIYCIPRSCSRVISSFPRRVYRIKHPG